MSKSDVSSKARLYFPADITAQHSGIVLGEEFASLASGSDVGTFVSERLDAGAFTELCVFLSCTTNGGSVEILVSYEKSDGTMTAFYSFGTFSGDKGVSASSSPSDSDAYVDIDTLIPRTTPAGSIVIKAVLRASSDGASPVLRQLGFVSDANTARVVSDLPESAKITVPAKSQLNVPSIGNSICSPTSVSMVLESLGLPTDQAEFAYKARDYGAKIFGNWLFNTAAAADSHPSIYAYIDFFDADALKYALSQGVPVVCSIRTSSASELEGSSMAYPSGHLVCVTGYKTVGGVEYYAVNDPAVSTADDVFHLYRCDQFENAWRSVVYIIQKYE